MDTPVKLIESPRDAWNTLPGPIPAEVKADYLRVLIAAGFKHIDAVSFASRTSGPQSSNQFSDSELVLQYLDPPDDVEIIALVASEKAAERALATAAVATLAFPYSVSPAFLQRHQNQTLEEALEALEAVGTVAFKAGADLVAVISMAFGNPFNDDWSPEEILAACDLLADSGVTQITLADTAGLATPESIAEVLGTVLPAHPRTEIGLHLHPAPGTAEAQLRAAYAAGCRRFDSVIGGLGDSPSAANALVTNLPTETLLHVLAELHAPLPDLRPLEGLISASLEIARRYGSKVQ